MITVLPSRSFGSECTENSCTTETGEMKYWKKPIPEGDEKNPWHNAIPNGISVEMTAYALLTYLERGLIQDAIPIMKWMTSQRNEMGGFASTQDTVVGLYALSKLGQQISSSHVDIQVSFGYTAGSKAQTTINVNQQKAMIMQKTQVCLNVRDAIGIITNNITKKQISAPEESARDRGHCQRQRIRDCSGIIQVQPECHRSMALIHIGPSSRQEL